MSSYICRRAQNSEGFSLIELTIAVAIIGILTTVAMPNLIAYRDRAQIVASLVSGTRGALAAAAAGDPSNLYPAEIQVTKASDLNQYGTNLSDNTYKSFIYKLLNSGQSYQIEIATLDGRDVCVRPNGIEQKKCS